MPDVVDTSKDTIMPDVVDASKDIIMPDVVDASKDTLMPDAVNVKVNLDRALLDLVQERLGRLDLIQDTSIDDATDETIIPLPKSPSDPTYMPDETDGNESSDFTVDGDDVSFADASMGGD